VDERRVSLARRAADHAVESAGEDVKLAYVPAPQHVRAAHHRETFELKSVIQQTYSREEA
jgi:hypothetical protein